ELANLLTDLERIAHYLGEDINDLTREPEWTASRPETEAIRRHLTNLVRRLRTLMTKMESVAAQTGVGGARNSLRLKALTRRIEESNRGLKQVVEVTEQMNQAIEVVANAASEAAQVASQVEQLSTAGTEHGQKAAESTAILREQMQEMSRQLAFLVEKVREITRVSHVIDGIAAQTRLLALNAAIEAARAGEHGRGFAVVANEVRSLAEKSGAQTKEIGTLVRDITANLEPVQAAVNRSLELMEAAAERTRQVGQALEDIRNLARTSAQHMEQVAASVQEQTAQMNSLYESTRQAVAGISGIEEEASHIAQATMALSQLSEESYQLLDAFYADTIFHRALELTRQLAVDVRAVFERVIDEGKVTLEQVLDVGKYTEIKGPLIQSLARLFDVSRVPPTGFDPPKYCTSYDSLVDEEIQKLLDEVKRKEPRINTCTAMDLDGYIPIHPSEFCKDWTGIREVDLVHNRTKKIYLGASLRAARMGLPQAAKLPERATREDFIRAGCDLRETPEKAREFLVQTYARDTGEVVILLSVPLFIKGHRWGVATATWKAE
ncbi:MAG TPA: methyl-accepting chemotaxis protein, partial [Symbiobacteriaceae bacterium]